MSNVVNVQEYSLVEFCVKVQELIKQGYEFDVESNDNCPKRLGFTYVAGMVKSVEQVEQTEEQQGVQLELQFEDKTEATATETKPKRKTKA
jgi:ATP-dependent RNA circularization protein (DNA/RNA ligase family)